ncbi:hypothetical protein AB4403_01785 [Vibrio breoganii]
MTTQVTSSAISETIQIIFNNKVEGRSPDSLVDTASLLDTVSVDIYSTDTRFIYELIQNADDAHDETAVDITISICGNYLVVTHNGRPFSRRDIEGLCSVNHGTKKENAQAIGYKGIGFKSVFTQNAANVYVVTDGEAFQFNKRLATELAWDCDWGNLVDWEKEQDRDFKAPWQILPFASKSLPSGLDELSGNVSTIIELDDVQKVCDEIEELFKHTEFLLFLRNTRSIELKLGSTSKKFEKSSLSDGTVMLLENGKTLSHWWLYQRSIDVPEDVKQSLSVDNKVPKKLVDASNVELILGFQLTVQDEGYSIKPLSPKESRLYTYLPTEVTEFTFPFLVNSNFIVDASREKIRKDNAWNRCLFENIGFLMVQSAKNFTEQKFSISSNLLWLRKRFSVLTRGESLERSFNKGLNNALESVEFIVNKDEELKLFNDVMLDQVGITDINALESTLLENYLSELDSSVALPNLLQLDKEAAQKLTQYDIEEFGKFELLNFIGSHTYEESVDIDSNFELLALVHKLSQENRSVSRWNKRILETSLLLTKDANFLPINQVCEPFDEAAAWTEGLNIVDPELYEKILENDDVYAWLKTKGFAQPSPVAFLETKLLPNLTDFVSTDNHLEIFDYLLMLKSRALLTKGNLKLLTQLPLLCEDGEFHVVSECALSEEYEPRVQPRKFGEYIPLISECYLGNGQSEEIKSLLIELGVIDDLDIITGYFYAEEVSDNYLNAVASMARDEHRYPRLISASKAKDGRRSLEIDYFRFLPPNKPEYLREYWEQVFSCVQVEFLEEATDEGLDEYFRAPQKWDKFRFNEKEWIAADRMRWGWQENNRVGIYSYFRFLVQTDNLLPSIHHGFKTSDSLLLNSQSNIELARDIIPVIDASSELSVGWQEYLCLKAELDLNDYVEILKALSNYEQQDNSLVEYLTKVYQGIQQLLERSDDWSKDVQDLADSASKETALFCLNESFERRPVCIKEHCETLSESSASLLFMPIDCAEDDRLRTFMQVVFGVKFADRTSVSTKDCEVDHQTKLLLLQNLPYLLAFNEELLSNSDIDNLIGKLEGLQVLHSDSIERNYWLEEECVHTNSTNILRDELTIYKTFSLSNITSSRLSVPIAEILELKELGSVVQASITSSSKEVSSVLLPRKSEEWLEGFLSNPLYGKISEDLLATKKIDDLPIENQNTDIPRDLDRSNQIVHSQKSILAAVDLLKAKGADFDTSDIAIEKYIGTRKIIVGNNDIYHVRSAKNGYLYLNYSVWDSLVRDSIRLLVFTSGRPEPEIFDSQQDIVASCVEPKCQIQVVHDGLSDSIDSMFNGAFKGQSYADIPNTQLVFKLADVMESNLFEGMYGVTGESIEGSDFDELS